MNNINSIYFSPIIWLLLHLIVGVFGLGHWISGGIKAVGIILTLQLLFFLLTEGVKGLLYIAVFGLAFAAGFISFLLAFTTTSIWSVIIVLIIYAILNGILVQVITQKPITQLWALTQLLAFGLVFLLSDVFNWNELGAFLGYGLGSGLGVFWARKTYGAFNFDWIK